MATYTFTAESKSKGQKAKSGNYHTVDIPFIFSRYGMEYKGDKAQSSHIPHLGCNIPNFDYKVLPLKKNGYLYVYYTRKNGEKLPQGQLYEEYEVSVEERTAYSRITYLLIAKSGKSIERVNSKHIQLFNFDSTAIVWVAFSEIKINNNRLKEICNNNDELKARFQKIDVEYWVDHYPLKNSQSVKTLTAADPDDINSSMFFTIDNLSNTKVYNFSLHDPISAAEDIEGVLAQKNLEFQSLVASLGTSLSKEEVYNQAKNGSSGTIPQPGGDQYASLFQSAVLLNNIFFSQDALKNDKLNDYRNLINRGRINAVLGRYEVLSLQLIIKGQGNSPTYAGLPKKYPYGLRDSLGMMMQSSYFTNVLTDSFCSNRKGMALYKNVTATLIHTLSRLPESVSHVLNIEPLNLEEQEKKDKWIKYIEDTFPDDVIRFGEIKFKYNSKGNIIRKLFEVQLDIPWDQNVDADVHDWFTANYSSVFNTISSIEMMGAVFLTLRNYSGKYNIVAARLFSDQQAALAVLGKIDLQDMNAQKYAQYMLENSRQSCTNIMIPKTSTPYGTRQYVENLVREREQKVATHAGKNEAVYAQLKIFQSKYIEKVLVSPLFAKIMLGLSSLNLLISVHDFIKYPNLNSGLKVGGSTSGVLAFYTALPRYSAYYKIVSRNLAKEIESLFRTRAGRFTFFVSKGITISVAASATFTLIMSYLSFREGLDMYRENNKEAGVWGIISGVAGFGMTAAYIATFFSTMIIFGVISIILLIIVLIATVMQLIKIKNYLEVYLECIIFQNNKYKLIGIGNDSYKVKHKLCDSNTLKKLTGIYKMKEKNSEARPLDMSDHNKMFEWLLNLITGISLTNNFKYAKDRSEKDLIDHNDKCTYRYPSRINFDIRFQYFPPLTRLEARLLFYPMGSGQGACRDLLFLENIDLNDLIMSDSTNSDKFRIDFSVDIGSYIKAVHAGQAKWILGNNGEEYPAALFSKVACYILQIRFVPVLDGIPGCYYPFMKGGRDVFIAYSETLLFDISKANAYSTISGYNSESFRGNRRRYYVDDNAVFVGTVGEIRQWAKPKITPPSGLQRSMRKAVVFGKKILNLINPF